MVIVVYSGVVSGGASLMGETGLSSSNGSIRGTIGVSSD
jgi:hypothetical protein